MVDSYLPIALVILAAAILAAGMITASHVLGRLSAGRRKVDLSPYECGVPPQDASHKRLTIRFQGRDFRLTDVAGEVVDKLLA